MNLKNFTGLIAIVLLLMAMVGTIIGSDNVSLLAGLACFNWITFQAEQIKNKLK